MFSAKLVIKAKKNNLSGLFPEGIVFIAMAVKNATKSNLTLTLKLLLILALAAPAFDTFAQSPGTDRGSVSGFVKEDGSGIPLESATIRLFMEKDSSLAGGAQTDSEGYFLIEGIKAGRYRVVASMVGHSTAYVKGIQITGNQPRVVLDTVFLRSGEATTEEIDVNAERSNVEFKDDKKIYNLENSILSKGGNATDVLKRIPSVEVDQDGNVSLRGRSNVRFMIDGKMVRQNVSSILEQTPAGSIESIEIISNPGSKYEAEGEAGLINIVLKKGNELVGYAGQFSLGAGNRDKYNAGLSLSKKNSRLNIYGNYNFRDFDNRMDGASELTNLLISDPKYVSESTSALMKVISHQFKLGSDFFVSPLTTLGLSATYQTRDRNSDEQSNTSNLDESGNATSNFLTNSGEDESGDAFDASFTLNKILSSPQHVLTGEATFAFNNEDENIFTNTQEFDGMMNPTNNTPEIKKSLNSESVLGGSFQLDLVQPLGKAPGKSGDRKSGERKGGEFSDGKGRMNKGRETVSKIEAGVKFTYRDLTSDAKGELFDYQSNSYVNDSSVTNNFTYLESIGGGYVTYAGRLFDIDLLAGLRGEYTGTKVEDASTDTTADRNYFDLFPSMTLSYNLSMTDKFQANYSRRINRPDARSLVPFVDNANPTNLRKGNPELKPEYVNSFQLTYLKFMEGFTINPSVYYRHTSDGITRFRTQIDSVTTLTTFENLDKIDLYGGEFVIGYQGKNNLFVNGSFNYSYTDITGGGTTSGRSNSGSSWTAKLNTGFRVWYDIDVQMAYTYQGKRPTVLGYIEPFGVFEAGLKKDLFNDALSISIRFSDIFNKQKFDFFIEDATYEQDFYRKRESRFGFLTLTYNFGAKEVKPKKRPEREDNRAPDIDF